MSKKQVPEIEIADGYVAKDGERVYDVSSMGKVEYATLRRHHYEWVLYFDNDWANVFYSLIVPEKTHKLWVEKIHRRRLTPSAPWSPRKSA